MEGYENKMEAVTEDAFVETKKNKMDVVIHVLSFGKWGKKQRIGILDFSDINNTIHSVLEIVLVAVIVKLVKDLKNK